MQLRWNLEYIYYSNWTSVNCSHNTDFELPFRQKDMLYYQHPPPQVNIFVSMQIRANSWAPVICNGGFHSSLQDKIARKRSTAYTKDCSGSILCIRQIDCKHILSAYCNHALTKSHLNISLPALGHLLIAMPNNGRFAKLGFHLWDQKFQMDFSPFWMTQPKGQLVQGFLLIRWQKDATEAVIKTQNNWLTIREVALSASGFVLSGSFVKFTWHFWSWGE